MSRLSKITTISNHFSYKSLLLVLILLLIPFTLIIRSRQKTSAAWFNDSWAYRKAVSIANSSGSNLTDFQVSISIGTSALVNSGKMQTDCDDIRVTDHQGKILPHWIEENNPGCNKPTDTKIWIKAPSLPTSGAVVYIYYGNPTATSMSDGSKVFELFDDFSNGLNDWTIFPGSHIGNTLSASITNGQMILNGTSAEGGIYKNNYTTVNGVVEFMARADQLRNGNDMAVLARRQSNTQYYDLGVNWGDNTTSRISKDAGHTNLASVSYTYGSGVFRLISGSFIDSSLRTYIDNNFKVGVTDTTYSSSGNVGITMDAQHESGGLSVQWTIDDFRVRKAVALEPTSNLQSEEFSPAPIAYWKFDEGVGDTAFDSTSNSHNGTLGSGSSAPVWQSEDQCLSGKCLYFKGHATSSINTNYDFSFDYNSSVTFSFWFKPTTNNTNSEIKNIISKNSYEFLVGQIDQRLVFFQWDPDGNNTIALNSYDFITPNTWYFINVIYDGTQHVASIYVNSKLNRSANIVNNNFRNLTETVKIGTGYPWGSGASPQYKGFLDEVKIYPYVRNSTQMRADYNSGKSRASTSKGSSVAMGSNNNSSDALSNGLVGYWKMDEGVGTTSIDHPEKCQKFHKEHCFL